MNSDKVAKAKALIKSGFYEDEFVLDGIFDAKNAEIIIARMIQCPLGKGDSYRDSVCDALHFSLGYVSDPPRKEAATSSGYCDIELPLRTELFGSYYQWQYWHNSYDLKSILIEVKNLRSRASIRAVQQLESYLCNSCLGRLGFLVSRNGFSKNSMDLMRSIARSGRCLILPFDESQCIDLVNARRTSPETTIRYLRLLAADQFHSCPTAA